MVLHVRYPLYVLAVYLSPGLIQARIEARNGRDNRFESPRAPGCFRNYARKSNIPDPARYYKFSSNKMVLPRKFKYRLKQWWLKEWEYRVQTAKTSDIKTALMNKFLGVRAYVYVIAIGPPPLERYVRSGR